MTEPGRFAHCDSEAARRYRIFKSHDPFPSIDPALLNSADIEDYVAATGMIWPFVASELKPASYGVRLGGKCIYWDDTKRYQRFMLEKEPSRLRVLEVRDKITIPKNSIVFISVEPRFRLPDYIAMRFNFTIREVYRGLLLGTGPLVDPGFDGKLSFPVHNLTDSECMLSAEEIVIYAEFTKLSPLKNWHEPPAVPAPTREGRYVPFPSEKLRRRELEDYLNHATQGRPIVSSIPQEIGRIADEARSAQVFARNISIGGGIAGIAVLVAVVAIIVTSYQISQNATIQTAELKAQLAHEVAVLRENSARLEAEIATTRLEVDELHRQKVPGSKP